MSALENTGNGAGFPKRDSSALAEALKVDRAALEQRARDPHAELKTQIHRACIARLGSGFTSVPPPIPTRFKSLRASMTGNKKPFA